MIKTSRKPAETVLAELIAEELYEFGWCNGLGGYISPTALESSVLVRVGGVRTPNPETLEESEFETYVISVTKVET